VDPDTPNDVVEPEVAEKKEDEVLEREGVEQHLMQEDVSEVGEDLEDVQDAGTGE
jgi:hypothetical protein